MKKIRHLIIIIIWKSYAMTPWHISRPPSQLNWIDTVWEFGNGWRWWFTNNGSFLISGSRKKRIKRNYLQKMNEAFSFLADHPSIHINLLLINLITARFWYVPLLFLPWGIRSNECLVFVKLQGGNFRKGKECGSCA